MAAPPRLTPDDLLRMPDDGWRYELIAGDLLRRPLNGLAAGAVTATIAAALSGIVRRRGLGRVFINVGYVLAADPPTVLGPSASFVRTDRMPPRAEWSGYPRMAPDLAVDVVLPTDATSDIARKVRIYLAAGVRLVWIVDPVFRTVAVHYPDRTGRILIEGESLDGEDVVPGFALPVAEVFA